jgi:hypothetical protein
VPSHIVSRRDIGRLGSDIIDSRAQWGSRRTASADSYCPFYAWSIVLVLTLSTSVGEFYSLRFTPSTSSLTSQWRVGMHHSTATMPRKRYTALDMQHLTPSSRSTSPLHAAPERCDSFLFESSCIPRDRAVSLPLSTEQAPLQLTDYCIPKPTSILALELLRFGSLEQAVKPSSNKETLPPGKPPEPPEPLVFAESDFPPLTKFLPHPSDLVDIKSGRRCITLPESWQQRQHHRASSAPRRKPETRTRKQTSRSIRYSNIGADSQGNRKTPSVLIEPGNKSPQQATEKPSRKDSLCPPVEVRKRRARNDMASAFPQMSGDARRHYPTGSTRFENRPPVNRATPCKNGPLCRKFQEGWILCPL